MSFYSGQNILTHYKYIHQGKDHTFLFIHSLGTDLRIWDEVSEILFPFGNILAYDLRGHGLSEYSIAPSGLDDYANDCIDLLNHLEMDKNIIPIGISVGGMIAQLLANKIPAKLSKLVLCSTGYKIGTDQTWNDRMQLVQSHGISSISQGVIDRWFSISFKSSHPEHALGYKNMLERSFVDGYIETCKAIRDADLGDIAGNIKIPSLVIVGNEDQSTTPELNKNLADRIEGSDFYIIQNAGHIPCIDSAIPLGNKIKEFISN